MTFQRGGIQWRTYKRLIRRAPLVIILIGGPLIPLWLYAHYSSEIGAYLGWSPDAVNVVKFALYFLVLFMAPILIVPAMKRDLFQRRKAARPGEWRAKIGAHGFAVLVLLLNGAVAVLSIVLIFGLIITLPGMKHFPEQHPALLGFTLLIVASLVLAPGLFTTVVALSERRGYSLVIEAWRQHGMRALRALLVIAVVSSSIGLVSTIGLFMMHHVVAASGLTGDVANFLDQGIRASAAMFGVIALTTAHLIYYERIIDYESAASVPEIFD